MDLDALLHHYLGTDDLASVSDEQLSAATDRVRVDFATEREKSRRFALWTLLDAMGDAPTPAEAFAKDAGLRAAAERYLDAAYRIERDEPS